MRTREASTPRQLPLKPLREQLPDSLQRPADQLHPQADLGVLPDGCPGERRTREEELSASPPAGPV